MAERDEERGRVQSEEYRRADPREIVEEDVAMMGPGGAPQEETSVDERREASRDERERAMAPHPPREA
jgi:hypothetical protein